MEIHSLRRTSQEEEEILPSAGTWRKESWRRLSLPYRALCAERKETDTSSLRYWHQSRILLPLLAVPPVQKTRLRYRGGIPRKWRGILLLGPLFSSLCVCFLQTCLIWSERGFFCGSRTNKRTRGDNSGQTLSSFSLSPCVFLSTILFVVSNELPFGQTNNNGGAAAVARTFVVAAQTDIFGPFQCTRERPIA